MKTIMENGCFPYFLSSLNGQPEVRYGANFSLPDGLLDQYLAQKLLKNETLLVMKIGSMVAILMRSYRISQLWG